MKNPDNSKLVRAKNLIQRIRTRNLFVCVGKSTYSDEFNTHIFKAKEEDILREIVAISKQNLSSGNSQYFSPVKEGNGGYFELTNYSILASPLELSQPFSQLNSVPFSYPIANYGENSNMEDAFELVVEDLIVEKMIINYGKRNKNPVIN